MSTLRTPLNFGECIRIGEKLRTDEALEIETVAHDDIAYARIGGGAWVRPRSTQIACPRLACMTDSIKTLHQKMDAAAAALDYEAAKRYRDRISLMRGGATSAASEIADTSGLARQQAGAMGLGTSQQRITPPADWRPPIKPDPMTTGRTARRKPRN